jgi:outer membrane protein assembly factor BamB
MSASGFCPSIPTATPTPPATQGTAVANQIDAAHTGAQFDTVVPPLVQRWSKDLGGKISYPLIVGGRIFVTVANPASSGTKLYALDEANGATLWGPVELGGNYGWSNAAYDSGRVFAVNVDGVLRAFDAASGALLWSKQLPGQYSFNSPPTASGGVVYVVGAGTGTTLYAVDERDGTVNWSNLLFSGNDSSPAVTSTGVFVAFSCNNVFDFAPQNGSLIWEHSEGCTGGGGSTPVFFGGRLHVGDFLSAKLMFDAPTGAVLGTFPPGPPPAFSGSTGFFLTGSILRARDAYSGDVRWSFTGDSTLISAPIVVNGYVYIGSSSGKVYALDASTGANVWTGNLGAAVQATESPVSRPHTGLGAGDGLIVVPASNLLVAYQSSPRLITDDDNHAIAVDSVTLVRDPFSVVGSHNFSSDQRTRVMIFTSNLGLKQPSSDLLVTAGGIPLTVEAVGTLAGVPGMSYIIVKLDPMLSSNVSVSVTFRGLTSNAGVLSISP